jgi:hypothetical protein
MTVIEFVMVGTCLAAIGICLWQSCRVRGRSDKQHGDFGDTAKGDLPRSAPGIAVELDCRACGRQNRVPSERLRDRPKCGGCKKTLMPGKRLTICHANLIEGSLRESLNAAWMDSDHFWSCLADHVGSEAERGR